MEIEYSVSWESIEKVGGVEISTSHDMACSDLEGAMRFLIDVGEIGEIVETTYRDPIIGPGGVSIPDRLGSSRVVYRGRNQISTAAL